MQLRCVEEAARRAKHKFGQKFQKESKQLNFNDEQLLGWGVEGLRSFAGDRAFQIGYVSQGEIRELLKWSADKERQKFEKGKWQKNPVTGDLEENPDWKPGMGQGFQSLMHKYGIPPEEQLDWWQEVEQALDELSKEGPILDLQSLPPELQKILGENAFHARVRAISLYIFDQMVEFFKKETGDINFGALGGTDDEGGEVSFDGGDKVTGQGEFEDRDKWAQADPKSLRAQFGIPDPEVDPSGVAPDHARAKFGRRNRKTNT
jgi:hypothetical protein